MAIIPQSATILVIGGGPGGSYAASALAREGFDVVLLEAAKFPRYHIGESMLPSLRQFMKFIDVEESVEKYGFTPKPGAAIKFNQYKREGYTDFILLDPNNGAWNVVRSEFDDLLLRHASKCGASVFEGTKVTEIQFEEREGARTGGRPVSASWKTSAGETGSIGFEYLVDASGRNGVMSTRYLKNRRFNTNLKNVACWGYWKGAGMYMPGTSRENAIWVEALTDESGWAWFIPLHTGYASIGIVEDQNISVEKRKALAKEKADSTTSSSASISDFYLKELHLAPGVMRLIENATLEIKPDDESDGGGIKMASDYSYAATMYAGDHFRLVGDAAAFIDPFFSSGVHLAFTGGLAAATSISAALRGDCTEENASKWHDLKFGTAYTRFLLIVLGVYKQIRAQSQPIMCDIEEDNFDRAFHILRPVIQGSVEVGKTLSEDELQKTMDFCRHLCAPTDPAMHEAVAARLDPHLLSPTAPILTEADVDAILDPNDFEARHVLNEINARKPSHAMYNPTQEFGNEVLDGWTARIEVGRLGLVHV